MTGFLGSHVSFCPAASFEAGVYRRASDHCLSPSKTCFYVLWRTGHNFAALVSIGKGIAVPSLALSANLQPPAFGEHYFCEARAQQSSA